MKYIIHILILLVLGTTSAFSQITFQAKVSKNKLGVNERLRIDFEMNKEINWHLVFYLKNLQNFCQSILKHLRLLYFLLENLN